MDDLRILKRGSSDAVLAVIDSYEEDPLTSEGMLSCVKSCAPDVRKVTVELITHHIMRDVGLRSQWTSCVITLQMVAAKFPSEMYQILIGEFVVAAGAVSREIDLEARIRLPEEARVAAEEAIQRARTQAEVVIGGVRERVDTAIEREHRETERVRTEGQARIRQVDGEEQRRTRQVDGEEGRKTIAAQEQADHKKALDQQTTEGLSQARADRQLGVKLGAGLGATTGALSGGGIGAVIGSFIVPGIGTAIGAAIGAALGGGAVAGAGVAIAQAAHPVPEPK
jgi:hypothetical protein